jgi:hypothetical protein
MRSVIRLAGQRNTENEMPRFNFRSSVTGRFVTRLFAKLFPWFVVRERR